MNRQNRRRELARQKHDRTPGRAAAKPASTGLSASLSSAVATKATTSDKPTTPKPDAIEVPAGAVRTIVPGIEWPGILHGLSAQALALQFQLQQTEWWSPERLRVHQLAQLSALVRHAGDAVPYYRTLFREIGLDHHAPLDEPTWARLPYLTRFDVQDAAKSLHAEHYPRAHGDLGEAGTSGSTAAPIKVLKTNLQQVLWEAGGLRDHLWQRRDLAARHAAIKTTHPSSVGTYPDGENRPNWGGPVRSFHGGPGHLLRISTPVEQQVEWLARIRPDYLNTFPSNLEAIARHCEEHGRAMPWLRGLRTNSEILHTRVRELCRRVFGLEIVDMYSSAELGYIALQSPICEELLVQAETNLVEVLDENGRPCAPGQVGRVIVTPLHAFAMPLLRYASGDLAEVGGPASCGRGLPVLRRVLGRERHMMRLPSGEVFFPPDLASIFASIDDVRQFQIVRTAERHIEMRLVTRAPLIPKLETTILERVRERFRFPFDISFVYLDSIPREPSGKFFDFKSEVG